MIYVSKSQATGLRLNQVNHCHVRYSGDKCRTKIYCCANRRYISVLNGLKGALLSGANLANAKAKYKGLKRHQMDL